MDTSSFFTLLSLLLVKGEDWQKVQEHYVVCGQPLTEQLIKSHKSIIFQTNIQLEITPKALGFIQGRVLVLLHLLDLKKRRGMYKASMSENVRDYEKIHCINLLLASCLPPLFGLEPGCVPQKPKQLHRKKRGIT